MLVFWFFEDEEKYKLIDWEKRWWNIMHTAKLKGKEEFVTGHLQHWAGKCYILPDGKKPEGELILKEVEESTVREVLRDREKNRYRYQDR